MEPRVGRPKTKSEEELEQRKKDYARKYYLEKLKKPTIVELTKQELEDNHQQEIADLKQKHQDEVNELNATINQQAEHIRALQGMLKSFHSKNISTTENNDTPTPAIEQKKTEKKPKIIIPKKPITPVQTTETSPAEPVSTQGSNDSDLNKLLEHYNSLGYKWNPKSKPRADGTYAYDISIYQNKKREYLSFIEKPRITLQDVADRIKIHLEQKM
jgi:hypothetical protein